MDVSGDYLEAQRKGKKPGLFQVTLKDEGPDTVFQPSGQLKPEQDRVVAISDQHKNAKKAATSVEEHLANAPIGGGAIHIKKRGFDLHFTPGVKKIGGLVNAQQARSAFSDKSLHESALLLAQTMESAREISGVSWITEGGGSGVMTQAMGILKNKGIRFDDNMHHVFFSHLTTSLVQAEQLARDIGLKFDSRSAAVNRLRPDELVGGLGFCGGYIAAWNRFQQDPERTALMLSGDIYRETLGSKNAAATLGVTAAAVATAVGLSTGGANPSALATLATALGGAVGVGVTLTQAWLPKYYHLIKKKFGA